MANVTIETPLAEGSRPAVVWGPIFAGAFAAVVVTVVLMLLGSGLGLTLVSPWSGESVSLTTIAASTAIWLVIVQWLSSALGGYLSGRLRTKWVGVHTDEVFFRDTAHGFMAWTVATFVIVALMGLHTTLLFGAGTQIAAGVANAAGQAAQSSSQNDSTGYLVDSLLRPADPSRLAASGAEADQAAAAQASRILAVGAILGEVSQEDRTYLASLVAARTGLAQQDAQARVEAFLTKASEWKAKAQQAADEARKVTATVAILAALTMMIGAFIASVAGAMGGRQRDDDELLLIKSAP